MSKTKLAGRILTAQANSAAPVPIIGKLKVGLKVTNANGKEIPQSVDYFVPSGKYEQQFREAYGDKPSTLEVTFISDDIGQVCFERFECRNDAGRLTGYSDGQTTFVWDDQRRMYVPTVDKQVQAGAGKWKPVLTLRFLLPRIKGVFGVWEYSTSGEKSSIPAIRDTFDYVQAKAGTVVGVPFDLQVAKVKSQKPDSNNTFPVVHLVPNLSAESLEVVRNWVEAGRVIRGMLSDLQVLELAASDVKALPPADVVTEG